MTFRPVEKPIKTGECTFVFFITYFKSTFIMPTLFPFELILYVFCAFVPFNIANISDVGIRKPSKMSTKHFLSESEQLLPWQFVCCRRNSSIDDHFSYMASQRLGDRKVIKFM